MIQSGLVKGRATPCGITTGQYQKSTPAEEQATETLPRKM